MKYIEPREIEKNRGLVLLIFLFILSLVSVISVRYVYSYRVAIRGIYAPLGIFISILLLIQTMWVDRSLINIIIPNDRDFTIRNIHKKYAIIILWSFSFAIIFDLHILLIFAIFMSLSAGMVSSNIHYRLTYILSGVLVSGIYKLIMSGFYLGHGDIMSHTFLLQSLLQSNSLSAIDSSSYYNFPIFHISISSGSLVTDVDPYPLIILYGLMVTSGFLITSYCLFRYISNKRAAILGTLLIAGSYLTVFYNTYYYPQSLAVYLFYVLLFTWILSIKLRSIGNEQLYLIILILIFTIILTHNLTIVILSPLLILYPMSRLFGSKDHSGVWFLPVLLFGAIIYWIYRSPEDFLKILILKTLNIYEGGASGRLSVNDLELGILETSQSEYFVQTVTHPEFIYFTLLACISCLSFSLILENRIRSIKDWSLNFRIRTGIIITGIVSSVLILEVPIFIKSKIRLGHPFIPLFAIAISIGIIDNINLKKGGQTILIVCLLMSSLAPLAAPDDFFTSRNQDRIRSSFDKNEVQQLDSFSKQGSMGDILIKTDRKTIDMMRFLKKKGRYGSIGPNLTRLETTSNRLKYVNMLYLDSWPGHNIATGTSGPYTRSVRLSDQWLYGEKTTNNRIYTAGQIGVIRKTTISNTS